MQTGGLGASSHTPVSHLTLDGLTHASLRFWIPRPNLFIRLLLGATLLLLAVMTVLASLMGRSLQQNIAQVGDEVQERHFTLLQQPMPPTTDLINQEKFAALLVDRPHQMGELYHARATLLAKRGHNLQAADHYRLARLNGTQPASVDQWLAEIDTWLALGRWDEAQQQLGTLLQSRSDPAERQAVLGRIGRMSLLQQTR